MNMKYLWASALRVAGTALLPDRARSVALGPHAGVSRPFEDPQGKGFHILQSMIAVRTGGSPGSA